MWKYKVERKVYEWIHGLFYIIDIAVVRTIENEESLINKMIELKQDKLNNLIEYCQQRGWKSSTAYLMNAAPDMFTALKNRLKGKTSSRVERVMRTVNLRINVGKWSTSGALNAMKIRLAYYYNGFDVE